MSPAAVRRFVLPLFFLTGASSLVYQVIWLRSLAYIFGSTTYATATVLSAFMGGLALGSYLFGKIADRARRPLAVYGVLEIGIGVFALLFPLLMNVYDDFYVFLEQKLEVCVPKSVPQINTTSTLLPTASRTLPRFARAISVWRANTAWM